MPNQDFLIMVAEDRPDQARFLEMVLQSVDYRVVCVDDGLKALVLLEAGMIPDLLVTDLSMRTVNGFELMEHMKRMELKVPTIITSGSDSKDHFEEAFVRGAGDYLVKPVMPTQLLMRIQRLLKSSAQ